MARIFPSSLANYDFKEPGEEIVFNLLKNLQDDCRVWYEIVLGVRAHKPDFMVLDPRKGIIILEVKDWGKTTILGHSPTIFRIKAKEGKTAEQKNPSRKCKNYIDEATEQLELDPVLVGKFDKLLFPVEYWVAFPNLSEADFDAMGLEKNLEKDHIIFHHEIKNSTLFIAKLYKNIPDLQTPLSAEMQRAIRLKLREENTINAPGEKNGMLPGILPDGQAESSETLTPDVFAIDIEQEELAKDLGGGPRLLRGIAGTGKTLIMLMRAKLLASNAEQQHQNIRILVLCWNVSLANYMRQAFNSINIPLSGQAHAEIKMTRGVPVMHFMEFARQLVKRHPEAGYFPISSAPDFEKIVSSRLGQVNISFQEKYDVIIVDEAQDFRDEWLSFLFEKMLLGEDPRKRNFIMAADDAQRIYKSRNFTWEGLGIPMKGDRSRILRKIYRNSARVWGFAAFLLRDIAKYYDENPNLQFTPKRGVDPKLVECKTIDEQIEECIREIKEIGKNGYSWRNVLIIYRNKSYHGHPLVEKLIRRLDQEHIPQQWITENMNSKNTFSWGQDSVKISTALSAKGLDAPKVIILNAESFGSDESGNDELKLLYVAMTRAREELSIYYSGTGALIPELLRCKEMYQQTLPKLIKLEKNANELTI